MAHRFSGFLLLGGGGGGGLAIIVAVVLAVGLVLVLDSDVSFSVCKS